MSCCFSDVDFVTELADLAGQALRFAFVVDAQEVLGAEIEIGNLVTHQMVGSGENGGSDGDDGLLATAAAFEAQELRL